MGVREMARTIGKLTALAVNQAKRRGYYGDGGGLFLQVSASGAKSWVFRFRYGGRLREMGLGPLHTISLAEARQKALACRKERLDGADPIEARRKACAKLDAAKAMTFQACAEPTSPRTRRAGETRSTQRSGRRRSEPTSIPSSDPAGASGRRRARHEGDRADLGAKPETAGRVRGRIESVLDWATARGYRQGENPARWRGHLENLLPKKSKVRRVEHHAALPYAEIAAFMAELRKQEGVAARALEFAILTAARTGEVIGARWDEIDLAERLWTVPGERMKAGKEHRVPLSDAALAIVEEMRKIRQGDLVFPGAKDRAADQQYGDVDAAPPDGPRRSDSARLPIDLP